MSSSTPIVCKPTSWFLLRASAMMLMFGLFSVLFYKDGSTGYREKNRVFFLCKTFDAASQQFSSMSKEETFTPDVWQTFAKTQNVLFPEDRSILPANLELPMKWPEILQSYEKMKSLNWNTLWLEYSAQHGLPASPSEEPYSADKIRDQWICFWVGLALFATAAFFLLLTLRRKIIADDQGVTSQKGIRVPYADMKTLDLRKWDTKGLAFLDYDGTSGKGRLRIDGLTYGGFKKDQGAPAERLIELIRSHFSGEILEYVTLPPEGETSSPDTPSKTN